MAKPRRESKGPIFNEKALAAWRQPGTFCDDLKGGLYLQVRQARVQGVPQWETDRKGVLIPKVTKYWVFRYWRPAKEGGRKLKEFGIGPFADYTLQQARDIAKEQRIILREFGDPILTRKRRKQNLRNLIDSMKTFSEAAETCWESLKPQWGERHAYDWLASLKNHVYPTLGAMEIRDIQTTHIETVLRPIWHAKAETGSRIRGRLELIFNFAKGKGWYSGDNPAAWDGNLDALFLESPRLKNQVNHPSLPFRQVGIFMEALWREKGTAARALEFTILTATRSGEVLGALGEEFDLGKALWTIPAERMKAKKEHLVPLSPRTMEILRGMGDLKRGVFVFPGGVPGNCLSDAAMNTLVKRMDCHRQEQEGKGWCDEKGERVVPHGFRATFKTWAQECSKFDRDVIEFALAHQLADKVEAAYMRGTMLEKRRPLMAAWADFCASKAPLAVSPQAFRRVREYTDPDPKIVKIPL